jgi:hypothetical protein
LIARPVNRSERSATAVQSICARDSAGR